MQAMYDLVGDKIQRDLRRPGRRHRASTTSSAGTIALPVHDRARRALPRRRPCPIDRLRKRVHRDPRAARRSTRRRGGDGASTGRPGSHRGRAVEVGRLRAADRRRRGLRRISLQNLDRDRRLQRRRRAAADDARREPERRARERAPGRRDAPARDRAGDRQRGRPGRWPRSSTWTRYRARRRAAARDVQTPTSSTSRCTTATRT